MCVSNELLILYQYTARPMIIVATIVAESQEHTLEKSTPESKAHPHRPSAGDIESALADAAL